MNEKQAVPRKTGGEYHKMGKRTKKKRALLDELTRLTGYHWKPAIRACQRILPKPHGLS